MHLNCALLFQKYATERFPENAEVLELGPVSVPSPFQAALGRPAAWSTADFISEAYDGGRIDYVMTDDNTIPCADAQFDVVLNANVIEHVRKPWRWLPEVARVCRPGGLVITITPVSWPYHEAPIDCWRMYPDGLRSLYEDAGLETVVATAESLEPPRSRHTYQGAGRLTVRPVRGARGRAQQLLGWPVPVAVDTIVIGVKPA